MPTLLGALCTLGGVALGSSPVLYTPIWTISRADILALTPGGFTASNLKAGLAWTAGSARTVQTSATAVVTGVASNTARCFNDGVNGNLILYEEPRTQIIVSPQAITAGSWLAGSGGTITSNVGTGPSGSSTADRTVDVAGGKGPSHLVGVADANTYCVSHWVRHSTGSGMHQWGIGPLAAGVIENVAVTTAWQKRVLKAVGNSLADFLYFTSINGGAGYAGEVSQASSVWLDLHMAELGRFPTSVRLTAGARSVENFTYSTPANLLSSGRMSLMFACRPLGAGDEYGANMMIWANSTRGQVEIDYTNRTVIASKGGVNPVTLGAIPMWQRGDLLELFVTYGAGTTTGKVRINGVVTDLGTGASGGFITPTGTMQFCNQATGEKPFSCGIHEIAAYANGEAPTWAQ